MDGTWDLEKVREKVERDVQKWTKSADRKVGVGARHHTVPRFCLRRFADDDGLIYVRDRETGKGTSRGIGDLAIKNFYTSVGDEGEFDGRIEQLLGVMETAAAELFSKILGPFWKPGPLDLGDAATLAQFLAFQIVRGSRTRREMELSADWLARTTMKNVVPPQRLAEMRAVPHPNEHLRLLGDVPRELARHLLGRSMTLVALDRPLLITSDEPVIVVPRDNDPVQHHPDCSLTAAHVRDLDRRARKRRRGRKQVAHIYPTRFTATSAAEEVGMPLKPTVFMVLGPEGEEAPPFVKLSGSEAVDFATNVNDQVIANALDWVAAHPKHESFAGMQFPPTGPLIRVCDGESVMSEQLKDAPSPRRPVRPTKGWPKN